MHELEIPPAARRDDRSVELVRAWVAEGAQWISLNPHLFRDRDFAEEDAWGMFLADTVRHLARAIGAASDAPAAEVEHRIHAALERELARPTSTVRGGYLED
ncbi:MAG: DUF5076 domain-containing protein [Ectothiorhodospiraceae bacterium]|nr:DUF5076 domain-containing protein [Chromatiales bacterium]MCP5153960.1 DUF5076 domain-containing protein [Ectothiorhodospiraceae bacterium]